MIKTIIIFILILFSLTSCSCIDSWNYPYYTLVKKEKEFKDLLFFCTHRHVYGIDPVDFEIKAILKFGTFIDYGDMSEDGTLFIADAGERLGVSGKSIFVISPQGKLVTNLPTECIDPDTIQYVNGKLIVTTSGYSENPPFQIFDINDNYKVIFDEKIIKTFTHELKGDIIGSNIYLGSVGENEHPPYIIELNYYTLKYRKITNCFKYNDSSRIKVISNYIFIFYIDTHEIYVFDLIKDKFITNYNVFEIVDLPLEIRTNEEYQPSKENITYLLLNKSFAINNDVGIHYYTHGKDRFYSQIIIDVNTLKIKEIIDLKDSELGYGSYVKYTTNNLLFYDSVNKVLVYDYINKKFIKKILLKD